MLEIVWESNFFRSFTCRSMLKDKTGPAMEDVYVPGLDMLIRVVKTCKKMLTFQADSLLRTYACQAWTC